MGDRGTAFTDGVTQSTDCVLWRMPSTFMGATSAGATQSKHTLRPDRRSSQLEAIASLHRQQGAQMPGCNRPDRGGSCAEHRRVVWWLGLPTPALRVALTFWIRTITAVSPAAKRMVRLRVVTSLNPHTAV